MQRADVIVAGLGAMGSATAAHLAMRGARVLGFERWKPGHRHGSSHGDSRIIREAYAEHPMYVPLVQRALALWRELEQHTGRQVLTVTGGLMIGPASGSLVQGTLASVQAHGLACELLDADELHRRHPAFAPLEGIVAAFDARAGHLDPEAGNAAHLTLARRGGAALHFDEPVLAWSAEGDGVQVRTPRGRYSAQRLCIAAGAYTLDLIGDLALPLTLERQVLHWFEVDEADARWQPPQCPIWIHEHAPGQHGYGFPRLARGVKASLMHVGEQPANAGATRRSIDADEVQALRDHCGSLLPALREAPLRDQATCLFTNTPDLHFVIDRHPQHPQVLISSPCSGHGYKFAAAIGELQARWLLDGDPGVDVSPFRISRFSA